jgi:NADH:ubiquinone oxidoreductase subunit
MTITTRLFTIFNGKLVGSDAFGNRYFTEKKQPKGRREKRWVMYEGAAEPSKVPAEWHGWLHYTFDTPPSKRTVSHHAWEKPHLPNLTGTVNAYVPPGHLAAGAERAATTSDYEAWKP